MKLSFQFILIFVISASASAFAPLGGWHGQGYMQVNSDRKDVLFTFALEIGAETLRYQGLRYIPRNGSRRHHFQILRNDLFSVKIKGEELWDSGQLIGSIHENEILIEIQRKGHQSRLKITRHPDNTVDFDEEIRWESPDGWVNDQAHFHNLETGVTDPVCADVFSVKVTPQDELFPAICDWSELISK